MKLVNLTPHTIILRDPKGNDHAQPPSGIVARVAAIPAMAESIAGIPVPVYGRDQAGPVQGLPDAQSDTMYIVSAIVGAQCPSRRSDVLVPGTGPADQAVRDSEGRIIAVTRLKRP